MYTSLMGTFDMLAPIKYLGMTSVGNNISIVVNRMNLWVLPSQEEPDVPFATKKVSYQAIFDATIDSISNPSISKESYEA